MAWMSSKDMDGVWWLTHEFSVERYYSYDEARNVSDALGFSSSKIDQDAVRAEVLRAETNRALLVKQVADAILPAIAAGVTVTAPVDPSEIARLVDAELQDDFQTVRDDVNRPRTLS